MYNVPNIVLYIYIYLLIFVQRMNTCWSILSSLPPPSNRNSSGATGEVDVTPQNQQRLLTVDRDRLRQDRDRAYYTQSQTQPVSSL